MIPVRSSAVLLNGLVVLIVLSTSLGSAWLAAAQLVTAIGPPGNARLWTQRTSAGLAREMTPAAFREEILQGRAGAPGFSAPRLVGVGLWVVDFTSDYREPTDEGVTPFFMYSMALEDGRWRLHAWTDVSP